MSLEFEVLGYQLHGYYFTLLVSLTFTPCSLFSTVVTSLLLVLFFRAVTTDPLRRMTSQSHYYCRNSDNWKDGAQ
jgi:hypothetical protein